MGQRLALQQIVYSLLSSNVLLRISKGFSFNSSYEYCIDYLYERGDNIDTHYENTTIQIYWKFYNQKRKIFR